MSPLKNDLSILVIDHNAIFLGGIISLIQSQGTLQLVGTATNEAEALELFSSSAPRIVLVDLDLPNSSALSTIRKIKNMAADVAVIGMATYEFDGNGQLALAIGAEAVIAKERIGEDLMHTVHRVCGLSSPRDASRKSTELK